MHCRLEKTEGDTPRSVPIFLVRRELAVEPLGQIPLMGQQRVPQLVAHVHGSDPAALGREHMAVRVGPSQVGRVARKAVWGALWSIL